MSDWTDERVEQLKKLWLQGWSASQIAKELGSTTRNAVIGKIHRLNLVARQSPKMTPPPSSATTLNPAFAKSRAASFSNISVKTPPAERSAYMPPAVAFAGYGKQAAPNGMSAAAPRLEEDAPRKSGQVYNPFKPAQAAQPSAGFGTMSGLAARGSASQQCQWPVGDPRSAGFHFCCGGTVEGLPYCPEHARLAYQPTAKSRRVSVGGDMHATGTPDEREIMVRV